MISFVPFALSIQNELPKDFPKFVLSFGEVALGGRPAALLQFSYWSDEEGFGLGGDFLYLSLLWEAYLSRKLEAAYEVNAGEEINKDG